MQLEAPIHRHVARRDVSAEVVLAAPRRTASEYRRLARNVAITDALSVLCGFALAHLLRSGPTIPPRGQLLVVLLAPPVWLAILSALRAYPIHRISPADQFRRLVTATSVGITLVVTLSFWTKEPFSRLWLALTWVTVLVALVSTRKLWEAWVNRRRVEGTFVYRTLIVGTNQEAAQVSRALSDPRNGFRPLAYVATDDRPAVVDDRPVVGSLSETVELVRVTSAECVFVAASAVTSEQMQRLMRQMRREGVEVRVSANLPQTLAGRIAPQPIGGVTTLAVQPVRLSGPEAAAKRTLDIVGALVGIVGLSPLFLILAIAVKVTSRGPITFTQMRVGRRGESIAVLKFRTMVRDAESQRDRVLEMNGVSGAFFNIREDPRVTRVGRVLRKWSLDELPQLLNVLMGDMSLVGPRPAVQDEVDRYEDWQHDRLEVRPGLTGLWQVSGRRELSFEDYVRLDLFYIENWSVAYDLYILAKTLPAVVAGRGAA